MQRFREIPLYYVHVISFEVLSLGVLEPLGYHPSTTCMQACRYVGVTDTHQQVTHGYLQPAAW